MRENDLFCRTDQWLAASCYYADTYFLNKVTSRTVRFSAVILVYENRGQVTSKKPARGYQTVKFSFFYVVT